MASTINSTSTGSGGIITTGDDSSVLELQTDGTTAISIDASQNVALTNALPVASGGTGVTTSTGTGNVVLSDSPTLVTPALGTPASGNLESCTADGTNAVGFRTVPQNVQTGSYTLVLADSGKHIYRGSGGAETWTIPANASVAYPIGTALTFINLSSTAVSIAITSDTMYLSSAGTTGTRTLAQYGSATAIKIASTTWIISGSGLT